MTCVSCEAESRLALARVDVDALLARAVECPLLVETADELSIVVVDGADAPLLEIRAAPLDPQADTPIRARHSRAATRARRARDAGVAFAAGGAVPESLVGPLSLKATTIPPMSLSQRTARR